MKIASNNFLQVYILTLAIGLLLLPGCGGGSDNLSVGGITPDDVDCVNDPDFNHVEPLPSGIYPSEFITEEGTFIRCEDSEIRRYADGTLVATWTGDSDDEFYTALRIAQKACDLGTEELPNYAADWVVTDLTAEGLPYYDVCFRIDLIPGAIFCQQLSGEDQETLRMIQYGQVVNTFVTVNDETCTLEEE